MDFKLTMQISMNTLMSDELLAKAREAGVEYLAMPIQFYYMGEDVIRERGKAMRNLGFQIDTCHPPYGGGNGVNSLCAEDEDVRKVSIATYQHCMRAFGITGVRAVPIHTGGAMHRCGGIGALERLTDSLEKILPEARKSGVILALENTFYANPCVFSDAPNPSGINEEMINDDCAMLRGYVMGWHDPLIRVCHDAGHSLLFGHTVEEDLKQLAPLTALYHIHDNDGVHDSHWNIGQGVFPWQMFVKSLIERNYDLPMFNEVLFDRYTDDSQEANYELEPMLKHYKAALETLSSAAK